MKRFHLILICLAMILGICACGQGVGEQAQESPTWQEQYDLGIRYLSEGNYQEAIIAFTAAIEIDPKQPAAYVGLANVYIATEDYDKAEEAITSGQVACGEKDMFDDILNKLVECRAENEGNTDNNEGQGYSELSERLRPDNAVSYADLPTLFSAPFNNLENYLPIINDSKRLGLYYEHTETGLYYVGNEPKDYSINVRSCDYDFYDYLDPSRPNNASCNRVIAVAPVESTEILDIEIRLVDGTIDEVGYYGSIGLVDILFGDSYFTVLEKLGFEAGQAEKYNYITLSLIKGGDVLIWGEQEPVAHYGDDPNAPEIRVTFFSDESANDGKEVELVFGEDSRLSFVRYLNYDLYRKLVNS